MAPATATHEAPHGLAIDLADGRASGYAVTFTATDRYEGDFGAEEVRVGKAFLVARLQALLQTDRVKLHKTAEADVLRDELLDYEIKVNENAHLTAGAMEVGTHDDLVTALGLATLDESIVTPAIALGQTDWPRRGGESSKTYRTDGGAIVLGCRGAKQLVLVGDLVLARLYIREIP